MPHLGFDNIIDLNNPTRDQVNAKVLELRKTVLDNAAKGKRSFIYAYYGGAGCHNNAPGQCLVLNGTDKHVVYPLESRLDVLSRADGDMVAVYMVFDCSRVPISPGLTLGQNIA